MNTYTFTITVESPTRLTNIQQDKILVGLEDQLAKRSKRSLELYDSEHWTEEEEEEE